MDSLIIKQNLIDAEKEYKEANDLVIKSFESLEKLQHIHDMILKHGFSKSMMEMSDPLNELPEAGIVPSYENLDGASLEGITDTIGKLIDSIISKMKNVLAKLKDKLRAILDAADDVYTSANKNIRRLNDIKSFDKEKLNNAKVEIMKYFMKRKSMNDYNNNVLYKWLFKMPIAAIEAIQNHVIREFSKKDPKFSDPKEFTSLLENILKEEKKLKEIYNIKLDIRRDRNGKINSIATSIDRNALLKIEVSKTEFITPDNCLKITKEYLNDDHVKNYKDNVNLFYDKFNSCFNMLIDKYHSLPTDKQDKEHGDLINDAYTLLIYIEKLSYFFGRSFFDYGRNINIVVSKAITCRTL